jgi:putative flippase GtrA
MTVQLIRFGLIGIVATIVHVLVALSFHHGYGLSPLWSNALAFITAWAFSYVGHWRWTFGANTEHAYSIPRFLVVAIGGFGLNQLIVFVATAILGWPLWLALIPAMIIVPLASFVASRVWAYHQAAA